MTEIQDSSSDDLLGKARLIHSLIDNQYRIVHHFEKLITDYAKIASMILALASLFGLPQALLQDSTDIFVMAFIISLIVMSTTCIVVIAYALINLGGWDVQFEESPSLSLWWYSDERLKNLKKNPSADDTIGGVTMDILDRVDGYSDSELKRDAAALTLLYARADDQLQVGRNIRSVFLFGFLFAFSAYFGAVLGLTIPSEIGIVVAPLALVLSLAIFVYLRFFRKK